MEWTEGEGKDTVGMDRKWGEEEDSDGMGRLG